MTGGVRRVTVVGPVRRLDLALPASAPVAELLPDVAALKVQLHTPESLAAQEAAHPLYEQARLLPEGSPERLALVAQQDEVFRRVPQRPGAEDLGARPQGEQ